jgi:hypothetical protein
LSRFPNNDYAAALSLFDPLLANSSLIMSPRRRRDDPEFVEEHHHEELLSRNSKRGSLLPAKLCVADVGLGDEIGSVGDNSR